MEKNFKQVTLANPVSRIAIVGASADQTSALANSLALHFKTVAANVAHDLSSGTAEEQFVLDATRQVNIENEQGQHAAKYLFCDSAMVVAKVASELRYGHCDPRIEKAARKHKYQLFFLLTDDAADKDAMRFTSILEENLIAYKKPYIALNATMLAKAILIVDQLEHAQTLGFSSADFVQMHDHGISIDNVAAHLRIFKKGIAKIILDRPATHGDGIIKMSADQYQQLASFFDTHKDLHQLEKFVPASGAASRMFKFLTTFYNEFDPEVETINAYINRKQATDLNVFLAGMEKFPFFDAVDKKLHADFADFNDWPRSRKNFQFIKTMLADPEFDFSNKPKAVLPFHKYATHIATPIEEHLHEAVKYAASNGVACLHFTVSDSHQPLFETIIADTKKAIAGAAGIEVKIGFSYQDAATDTVAVDLNGNPFRDGDKLVFRPAGHGALLSNLNQLKSDIIFIKNIDNVIQDHIDTIALYKKALAGLLVQLRRQVFDFLNKMDGGHFTDVDIESAKEFVHDKLNIKLNGDFEKYTATHKISHLHNLLNRPIRVCGMVKNEGEPGGGPFWVRDNHGIESLQIVETSQVDMQNASQLKVVQNASYFNPVDIVCGIKDYKGNTFNLANFTDPDTGFIVSKTKNGHDYRAYELPGLWNGAMANWITVFAEVPLITFNPVKTVNDLLKPAHQPQ